MHKVHVEEAQGRLAELIEEAAEGRDVQPDARPRFGSARGMFSMADDFDEPLDDLTPYER